MWKVSRSMIEDTFAQFLLWFLAQRCFNFPVWISPLISFISIIDDNSSRKLSLISLLPFPSPSGPFPGVVNGIVISAVCSCLIVGITIAIIYHRHPSYKIVKGGREFTDIPMTFLSLNWSTSCLSEDHWDQNVYRSHLACLFLHAISLHDLRWLINNAFLTTWGILFFYFPRAKIESPKKWEWWPKSGVISSLSLHFFVHLTQVGTSSLITE